MKPPYYYLTSRCDNTSCAVTTFTTTRKKISYIATDGRTQPCTRQVCPGCKAWGTIIQYEEVTTK